MDILYIVAPFSLVEIYQRFVGPCSLHHHLPDDEDSKDLWNYCKHLQVCTAPQPIRQLSSNCENLNSYKILCCVLYTEFTDKVERSLHLGLNGSSPTSATFSQNESNIAPQRNKINFLPDYRVRWEPGIGFISEQTVISNILLTLLSTTLPPFKVKLISLSLICNEAFILRSNLNIDPNSDIKTSNYRLWWSSVKDSDLKCCVWEYIFPLAHLWVVKSFIV